MDQELSIKCGGIAFEANMLTRTIYVAPCHVPEALGAILEAMEVMDDDSTLCQALADHPDFCELAAQVAVIRKLQRELGNRDATDADHGVLSQLRRSPNPWIHREAGNLLAQIADECGQVAAHDGVAETQTQAPGEDSGELLIGVECWVWWHGESLNTISPKVGIVETITPGWYVAKAFDGGVLSGNHARPVSMGRPEVAE